MNYVRIFALGLSAFALTTAAHAADLSRPAAPAVVAPAAATDWTGFYIGAFGGYGWATLSADGLGSENATGGLAGVQAGYDLQSGQFVFGVQTDVAKSWMIWNGENPGDTVDWLGSTTARVGVALDNVLPYVKGGIAYGGGTGHNNIDDHDVAVSANSVGWTVGAGIEAKLTDQLSAFAEYDYYDLGKATFTFYPPNGSIDVGTTANVVKAGLNFHF